MQGTWDTTGSDLPPHRHRMAGVGSTAAARSGGNRGSHLHHVPPGAFSPGMSVSPRFPAWEPDVVVASENPHVPASGTGRDDALARGRGVGHVLACGWATVP